MSQALTVLRAWDRSASKTDKNPFLLGADVLVEQNRDVTTILEDANCYGEGKAEEGWRIGHARSWGWLAVLGGQRGPEKVAFIQAPEGG